MPGTILGVGYKIVSKTNTKEIYILVKEGDIALCKQTNKFNICEL